VSPTATAAIAFAGLLLGMMLGYCLPPHGLKPVRQRQRPEQRILLPFTGQAISRRAFQAAIRLAKAENATLMPTFLARVPRQLPLDSPLPAQSTQGMPLLEAIEQRASREGIPVDARVSRGRSYRDALRHLLEQEHFDRIIISATDSPRKGLSRDDLKWLLEAVPAEVLILRPAPEDTKRLSAAVSGHF
jgi:nucleotide-binding universal stress UspA family protein